MKVGDLVKESGRSSGSVVWLVVFERDKEMLVQSLKTGFKMWGNKISFEVLSGRSEE